MSYLSINPDGTFADHEGYPTFEEIARLVAAPGEQVTVPEMVARTGQVALWGNGDFRSLNETGRVERNPLATVLAGALDGAEQPYAGTFVLTGANHDPWDGVVPWPLSSVDRQTALRLFTDVRAVMSGTPVDIPGPVLDHIRRLLRTASRPWAEYGPAVTAVSFASVDEALDFIRNRGQG
jgi:hypothetical protein